MDDKRRNLWDTLPTELIDRIVLHTDLDTAILTGRFYCINRFLKLKKNSRVLNWVDAAKTGKVHWMEYMLKNNVRRTHKGCLIEIALLSGQIECAKWLWLRRNTIRSFLYPSKHQRFYNDLVTDATLTLLIKNQKQNEAFWFLEKTTYTFSLNALYTIPKVFPSVTFKIALLCKCILNNSNRMTFHCVSRIPVHDELLLKLEIRDGIHQTLTSSK